MVVGVLLALAVGGFFAYGPIVENAKLAKVKSAVSQIFTAVTVAQIDGDPATSPKEVIDAYNSSQDTIRMSISPASGAVIAAMATQEDYVPKSDSDFCLTATDLETPKITAEAGNCFTESDDKTEAPVEEVKEEIPAPLTVSLLKNGDFSDGLNHWTTSMNPTGPEGPGVAPVASLDSALVKPFKYGWSSIQQAATIPAGGIAYLQYAYRFTSGHISSNCGVNLTVKISNVAGALLQEVAKHCPPQTSTTEALQSVDLTAYAGQDIKLEFVFTNDSFDTGKAVYLDNIQIESTKEAPSAPTNVTTSVEDTDATVNWKAPSTGYTTVTSYTVKPYRNEIALPEIQVVGSPPATSTVFKGLTSGGTYRFEVVATNNLGMSQTSEASEPFTKTGKTLENGDFSAALTGWTLAKNPNNSEGAGILPVASAGEALLKPNKYGWNAIQQTVSIPSGGITYLQYSYRLTGGQISSNCGVNLSVKAYNAAGTLLKDLIKNCSLQTATPVALQSVDLTAYAGQDIKLEFIFNNNTFDTGKAAYLDDVQVKNSIGAPSAPTDVATTVNDTDATVSWKAPSTGFASVTSYTVKPYRNGAALQEIQVTGSPAGTSTVFKGLTSGGTYSFEVTATNSLGTSPASAASAPFTKDAKALENGDFTAGLTGWTLLKNPPASESPGILPTASAGEAFIKPSTYGWSAIRQTVTIPTAGNPKLNYSYRFTSGYVDGQCGGHLTVKVFNTKGDLLNSIAKHCAPQAATTATAQSLDLTPYSGQDVKIEFIFTNNRFDGGKAAYVDNVSIQTS